MRLDQDLNGWWGFGFFGDASLEALTADEVVCDDELPVPSCFDATPRYVGRRGVGAYRRTIRAATPDGMTSELVLAGVHHTCRVLLDGREVGRHHGGFTRFAIDLGRLEGPSHDLLILVDNRLDPSSSPLHQSYFDWYHYGGISRGVRLRHRPAGWLDAVRFVTLNPEAGRFVVEVEAGGEGRLPLRVRLAGEDVLSETLDAGTGGRYELARAGLSPWSPHAPALHRLEVVYGDERYTHDVGLRTVAVDGDQLLVNGRAVELRGVCRHELHVDTGHVAPTLTLQRDLTLIEELGCNFVRGSHYPQDPAFLRLCDRHGLMVWSEAIAWNPRAEHLTDPAFLAAHTLNVREMVDDAMNHPSVVLWGVFNEGRSDQAECRPAYEEALGLLRELDPARPVTYATCRPEDDVCYDLADVIAVNTYPGWYNGEIEQAHEHLDRIADHLDADAGAAGKPRIVSEIGAGAIYGWRDPHAARWTEDYQARLFAAVLPHVLGPGSRWNGVSLWQFADIRTSQAAATAVGRPRCFNNKGLLDEYRRPKSAFAAVAQAFAQAADVDPGSGRG